MLSLGLGAGAVVLGMVVLWLMGSIKEWKAKCEQLTLEAAGAKAALKGAVENATKESEALKRQINVLREKFHETEERLVGSEDPAVRRALLRDLGRVLPDKDP